MKESSFSGIRDFSQSREARGKKRKNKKIRKKRGLYYAYRAVLILIYSITSVYYMHSILASMYSREYIAYMFVCIGAKYFINVILCILYSRESITPTSMHTTRVRAPITSILCIEYP